MDFPQSLSHHHAKLREHERRLDDQGIEQEKQRDRLTDVRIELAKLLAVGLLIVTVMSSVSTALIVHYLSPSITSNTPAGTARVGAPK